MALSEIGGLIGRGYESLENVRPTKNRTIVDNFASYLGKAVNEVNEKLKIADEESRNLAIGKNDNIHEAMIALEKADITFKLLVQVRNKALEAYRELIQMQV